LTPKTLARTAGVLNLLLLAGGIVAQGIIADGLVVRGDAATTATNIMAHPRLWALGLTFFLAPHRRPGRGRDAREAGAVHRGQISSALKEQVLRSRLRRKKERATD